MGIYGGFMGIYGGFMGIYGGFMGISWWIQWELLGFSLVNVYITMKNHHAIDRKTHDFDWAMFNSYVQLPESSDGECFML